MGYSEGNTFTLAKADVPTLTTGQKLYFYVQAYKENGVGTTGAEKARYLNDNGFTGSAWSTSAIVTKA